MEVREGGELEKDGGSKITTFIQIGTYPKVWGLENNTNLNSIICLVKSSEMGLIFLPALYLNMCLTKEF